MGDRTQRLKGKANEKAGKAKGAAGYNTGSGKKGRRTGTQRKGTAGGGQGPQHRQEENAVMTRSLEVEL